MNEEEEKKMLEMVKQMKAIPMPIYEGMALPTFPLIREKGVEKVIDDIMNLQTRETDILICTLGKSGIAKSVYEWTSVFSNILSQRLYE